MWNLDFPVPFQKMSKTMSTWFMNDPLHLFWYTLAQYQFTEVIWFIYSNSLSWQTLVGRHLSESDLWPWRCFIEVFHLLFLHHRLLGIGLQIAVSGRTKSHNLQNVIWIVSINLFFIGTVFSTKFVLAGKYFGSYVFVFRILFV